MPTITRNGITITLSATNVLTTGFYFDGEPWVQLDPAGSGMVTVTGWTPAMSGSGPTLINGAMKNARGNVGHDQGFDGRSLYFTGAKAVGALPVTLFANDVLLIGKSSNGSGDNPRPSYFPEANGRSYLDEMVSLTVVTTAPTATDFRPNAIGNPASRQRVTHAQVQWHLLPDSIASTHPNAPPLADPVRIFSTFHGEVLSGWSSDQITPNLQHPGYGREMASSVSEALMMAMSDLTQAQKQTLVLQLIQKGIDLWGAWRDGRSTGANGGHQQARKALIIFAGHMLGDASMADPDATLGAGKFRENDAHYRSGTDAWWGPRQRWSYNRGNADASSYEADDPSTWTLGEEGTDQWFDDYRGRGTICPTVGQAIAMALIGRVREWGVDIFAGLWWHMAPTTAALLAAVPSGPNGFQYWHARGAHYGGPFVGTGGSHRGGAAGVFQSGHWGQVIINGLRPHVSYGEAIPAASETPLPVTFDAVAYDVPFMLEVTGAPAGASATVWLGPLKGESDTHPDGWVSWIDTSDDETPIELESVPNTYGYHREEVTVPAVDDAIASEIRWCLQVVYDLGGGEFVSSHPLLLFVPADV